MKNKTRQNIYLWTGNGWGKTTSAIGVAVRAVGQGRKVIIVQFMKGQKRVGEYKARGLLGKNYEIHQFGRKEFVNLRKPSAADRMHAQHGLEFAGKALRRKPFLLVLDEINLAARAGLVGIKEVLELIDKAPKATAVYLTGRYAPKEFVARADYFTEVKGIKRPKSSLKTAKRGIDY